MWADTGPTLSVSTEGRLRVENAILCGLGPHGKQMLTYTIHWPFGRLQINLKTI